MGGLRVPDGMALVEYADDIGFALGGRAPDVHPSADGPIGATAIELLVQADGT